jgi:hypothetical protein
MLTLDTVMYDPSTSDVLSTVPGLPGGASVRSLS